MQDFSQRVFDEFHNAVEMFWWSFIKAPLAMLAAWAFFSMLTNPANVAAQSMQIARSGGMPESLMTGIVTAWFLCGCSVLGVSLIARFVLKLKTFGEAGKHVEGHPGYSFHP